MFNKYNEMKNTNNSNDDEIPDKNPFYMTLKEKLKLLEDEIKNIKIENSDIEKLKKNLNND